MCVNSYYQHSLTILRFSISKEQFVLFLYLYYLNTKIYFKNK